MYIGCCKDIDLSVFSALQLFEYWLHPQRYRTEMCQFGASCTRPVCFFAHGEHQLRHTGMPGGPQPVVGPPEPIPSAVGAYGQSVDPAVKQQQQLLALQAAAAGFSNSQLSNSQRNSTDAAPLLPMLDQLQSAQLPQAMPFGGLMDSSSGMDIGAALQNQFGRGGNGIANDMGNGMGNNGLIHQLSPELLLALQTTNAAAPPQAPVSPLGNGVLHQRTMPASGFAQHLGGGRPPRSFTPPAVSAPGMLSGQDNAALMDELTKQLAVLQLMQHTNGSGGVSDGGHVDMLGQLAQLQKAQQQRDAALSADYLGLVGLLGTPPAVCLPLQSNGLTCLPLAPAYSDASLQSLVQATPTVSTPLPRLPSDPAAEAAFILQQQQQQMHQPAAVPGSPAMSDNILDAPRKGSTAGRDAAGRTAGQKKQLVWSAPVSPCNSSKGDSDLLPSANDLKLTRMGLANTNSSSSSASSTASSVNGSSDHLTSVPSEPLKELPVSAPSLSAGLGLGPADLHAVNAAASPSDVSNALQQQGMGQEQAVKLLAQLPEASVRKLLDLVAQQQVA
eukprot:GHRR01006948.1.p1 GENE.GHRR01006948.1~~GHRR01006948.1.p1  ORF type:complete len:558 (+),score=281.50 GHRR01006948.1:1320-2993(+)